MDGSPIHRMLLARRRIRRPRALRRWHRRARVHWWLRLIGWAALATPIAVLVDWWLAPLGALAFEILLALAVVRRAPVVSGRGPGTDPSAGGAGVREPRRPIPTGGAGSAEFGPATMRVNDGDF